MSPEIAIQKAEYVHTSGKKWELLLNSRIVKENAKGMKPIKRANRDPRGGEAGGGESQGARPPFHIGLDPDRPASYRCS